MAKKGLDRLAEETVKPGAVPMHKKVHINAKIDEELKRSLKITCAKIGVTMQDFLEDALITAIAKAQSKIDRQARK